MNSKAASEEPVPRGSSAGAPPIVRNFSSVRNSDIVKLGYTPQCKGCGAMRLERASQGHSDVCRARIVELLKHKPETRMRVDRADDARTAKLARYGEQQDVASMEAAAASGGGAGQ